MRNQKKRLLLFVADFPETGSSVGLFPKFSKATLPGLKAMRGFLRLKEIGGEIRQDPAFLAVKASAFFNDRCAVGLYQIILKNKKREQMIVRAF